MAAKYVVKEIEPFEDVRVFLVSWAGRPYPETTNVWVGENNTPRCCHCQTALHGMSSSCQHSGAVRRFLQKEKKS